LETKAQSGIEYPACIYKHSSVKHNHLSIRKYQHIIVHFAMKLYTIFPAFLMGMTVLASPAPAIKNEDVSPANIFARQDSHAFCAKSKCSATLKCPINCARCDTAKGTCVGMGNSKTCEPSSCGKSDDCAPTCAGCCGVTGKCVKHTTDCKKNGDSDSQLAEKSSGASAGGNAASGDSNSLFGGLGGLFGF